MQPLHGLPSVLQHRLKLVNSIWLWQSQVVAASKLNSINRWSRRKDVLGRNLGLPLLSRGPTPFGATVIFPAISLALLRLDGRPQTHAQSRDRMARA